MIKEIQQPELHKINFNNQDVYRVYFNNFSICNLYYFLINKKIKIEQVEKSLRKKNKNLISCKVLKFEKGVIHV
jgi:hypothetical protein